MPAAGFQRIDHTADVGLRLTAPTVAELFVVATDGLRALWGLPDAAVPPEGEPETLEVSAPDTEGRLVAWLNELIYQAEVHARVPAAVQVPRIDGERFRAEVRWQPLEWDTSVEGVDIKAATYHTVHITDTADGVTTTVIFDV